MQNILMGGRVGARTGADFASHNASPSIRNSAARGLPLRQTSAIRREVTAASRRRATTPVPSRMPAVDRHLREQGQAEAVVDHLHQSVERGAEHRRLGAKLGPVAGGQSMVLEAMAVLEQQQTMLVDRVGRRCSRRGSSPRREGDVEPVVEQFRRLDLAATDRARRAARNRAGRGGARRRRPGWSPRAGTASGRAIRARSRGRIAGSRKGAIVGITPMRSSPDSGLPAARAMSASSSASRSTRRAFSAMRTPSGVKRTTRRVRSTRVTPIRVSSSRIPAESVDWVTKQLSAARPKWP